MKAKIILFLFRLLLLFEILWGAHAWFTWEITSSRMLHYFVLIALALIAFAYKKKMRIRLCVSTNLMFAFCCYALAVLLNNRLSIPSIPGILLKIFPIWVALSDKINLSKNLQFIAKGIVFILIPGIILHIFLLINNLPAPIIQKGDINSYFFFNYIFLLKPVEGLSYASIRFQSIFLEPGYLGTMLSFLLFALKFDFSKKYNYILLIGLLLSLSLAGYITTLIAYIIFLFIEKKSFKTFIKTAILLIVIYSCSLSYNDGNNYINITIIERLKLNDDKGITGNNRTGEATDFYYDQAIENGAIILGLGPERVNQINGGAADSAGFDENIRGAGYKVYFVTYGIFSAFLFFLFYYYLGKSICKRNLNARLGFLFLIILTFIQAAYPESTSWIYPYILGLLNYNEKVV